jgi:hypothetical protein
MLLSHTFSCTLLHCRAILVAGAGPIFPEFNETIPSLHVYDAASGELRASCSRPDGDGPSVFINDVTAIDGTAYATDSFINSILTVDVEAALNVGDCETTSIELPEVPFLNQDNFQANGTHYSRLRMCPFSHGRKQNF